MPVPGNKPDHPQQQQQYGNRHNDRKKKSRPARLRCALHAAAPLGIRLHLSPTPIAENTKTPRLNRRAFGIKLKARS
jgi:hypothetical protein